VKYGTEFGANNQPWCQVFVWWVFKHAGASTEMPKTSITRVAYPWYKRNRALVPVAQAKPGDVVWFDFSKTLDPVSHVGIVEKNLGGGRLQTIEGNTTRNGHGGPEGVHRRTRSMNIVGVGRPHLLMAAAAATHPLPDKKVHVVVAGDTLFGIAAAWGVSLDVLKKANPKAGHPAGNFNNIHPGDKIVHP
jgi:CHAP domain/LysM domain